MGLPARVVLGSARRVVLVGVLAVLVGLVLAASAGAAVSGGGDDRAGRQPAGVGPIAGITEDYVVRFYPLWFTYHQSLVVEGNTLLGPVEVTPLYQIVVAINVDTVYASTFVDVSSEPVIVTVPATEAGYSVLNLDVYGNVFESGIPSKPSGTVVPETVYGLVPPGYGGALPAGVIPVEMPFDVTVLIFRIDKFSPMNVDQTQEATDFRAALRLLPLSEYIADPSGGATRIVPAIDTAVPFKTVADALLRFDPIAFLRQLQTAVHSSNTPPLTLEEQVLSDAFDVLFGEGGSHVNPADRILFGRGGRAAYDAIQSNYLGSLGPNNWIHFTNIGEWGNEVLDRASLTEFIQYGNSISTAAYYHTFRDGTGEPLDGSTGAYVLTFPPGGQPPAERFWSVTAYTPNAIELIPNPAQKYAVASYTPGLVTNPDGSVSIFISRTKPFGVPEANWLPVSSRPFNLMLRVYGVQPGSSVANNTYVPPPVVSIPTGGGAVESSPECDPLLAACGAGAPVSEPTPTVAPSGGDSGPAVGTARMPNLRATASATWQNGTIRVTVRVLISKPGLVHRWFSVRVRVPWLDATRLLRVPANGKTTRTFRLTFTGPASAVGKRVIVSVDPTDRITETRERDNTASTRIR